MVQRSVLVASAAISAMLVVACEKKQAPTQPVIVACCEMVHTVTVSPPLLQLTVGSVSFLTARVDADPNVPATVSWTSSDTSVATVNTYGYVLGRKVGSVMMVARSDADPTVKGAAAVQVTAP